MWTASSPAHMPPIEDILLEIRDLPWLRSLSGILDSNNKEDNRKRNALEYYYNAWFLTAAERCALFFSSLEAIFGADNGISTQGIREGILRALPEVTDEDRLKKITDLRNSIVHGGAPDAYSSNNYRKYYRKYRADMLDDVELLTERCLRTVIFGENFREQPDPHAEIISKYQGLGVLPTVRRSNSILS